MIDSLLSLEASGETITRVRKKEIAASEKKTAKQPKDDLQKQPISENDNKSKDK